MLIIELLLFPHQPIPPECYYFTLNNQSLKKSCGLCPHDVFII